MLETFQASAAKKTEIFERAERYVKEYRAKENDAIRFRREAKAAGNIHVPAEVSLGVAFVFFFSASRPLAPAPFQN
ncbi:unnamed protein product [Scytosiphon promiscuus]